MCCASFLSFPLFTHRTAIQQVRMPEARSANRRWRNRFSFLQDSTEIEASLALKRSPEIDRRPFRGVKALRALISNRNAVGFAHAWRNENDSPTADSAGKDRRSSGRPPVKHPGLFRLGR